jgi:hypothetical protein
MKKLLFLFVILPGFTFAQSKTDFENACKRFKFFYNGKQIDSLNNMFQAVKGEKPSIFNKKNIDIYFDNFGKLETCKYEGIDNVSDQNRDALFKIKSTKKVFVIGFTLDKENKFVRFQFNKKSTYIDRLLSEK